MKNKELFTIFLFFLLGYLLKNNYEYFTPGNHMYGQLQQNSSDNVALYYR